MTKSVITSMEDTTTKMVTSKISTSTDITSVVISKFGQTRILKLKSVSVAGKAKNLHPHIARKRIHEIMCSNRQCVPTRTCPKHTTVTPPATVQTAHW